MEAKQNKRGGQSGEIMLEASIVFVPVLILLLAMLSLGFWFYQMAMMTNVASEIAAEVARNLKFEDLADHGDAIGPDDVTDLRMFRSTIGRRGLESTQNERGNAHGDWRVPLTSLGFGPQDPDVDVELTRSGIGRLYVKVTVRQETNFFLSGILEFAGITEDHPVFGGTAYAECVDLMEYASMVNFLQYGTKVVSDNSDVVRAFSRFFGSIEDLLHTLGFT